MKKPKRFNPIKFVKSISREVFKGAVGAEKVHSSKKGKKGYDRRDGKKIPRE